jgi:hypothetical protein
MCKAGVTSDHKIMANALGVEDCSYAARSARDELLSGYNSHGCWLQRAVLATALSQVFVHASRAAKKNFMNSRVRARCTAAAEIYKAAAGNLKAVRPLVTNVRLAYNTALAAALHKYVLAVRSAIQHRKSCAIVDRVHAVEMST